MLEFSSPDVDHFGIVNVSHDGFRKKYIFIEIRSDAGHSGTIATHVGRVVLKLEVETYAP